MKVYCGRCCCVHSDRDQLPGDQIVKDSDGSMYIRADHKERNDCLEQLRLGDAECDRYIRIFSARKTKLTEIHNGIVEEAKRQ